MENLYILKIILKDSSNTNNEINKKLFEFLNNNYKEIINSNYYIQPILINNVNLDYFVKKNIQSTPSLLDEKKDKVLTGLNQIIKYIVKLCECNSESDSDSNSESEFVIQKKNNKTDSNKKNENYDNNELQNFLLNEAFNNDDTIEEPLNLDKVKSQENKYKKKETKINNQYSNNLKETYKKNFTNNNISVENLNNDKKYYNNNDEITKTKPVSDYMSDDKDLKKFWENFEESI